MLLIIVSLHLHVYDSFYRLPQLIPYLLQCIYPQNSCLSRLMLPHALSHQHRIRLTRRISSRAVTAISQRNWQTFCSWTGTTSAWTSSHWTYTEAETTACLDTMIIGNSLSIIHAPRIEKSTHNNNFGSWPIFWSSLACRNPLFKILILRVRGSHMVQC